MLRTSALDYELPAKLIATAPAEPRDAARLMVVRRSSSNVEHDRVRDLPALLRAGDRVIFNDTRVAPARLLGQRIDTAGGVEGLWLSKPEPGVWRMMLKSNGRLRPGLRLRFVSEDGESTIEVETLDREGDSWRVRAPTGSDALESLLRVGRTPLPPYILRARRERREDPTPDARDRDRYQTAFADRTGAVAAPTAGLHFTPDLLRRLAAANIDESRITLHVGAGTFKPVECETVESHPIHSEWFEVSARTLRQIESTRCAGGRIIAVGTTSVRTLESLPARFPEAGVSGETSLLITPGFAFRHVDGIITNFHLPRSTLLALVAAFLGLERTMAAYRVAVAEGYRFYSYGDAMLILP